MTLEEIQERLDQAIAEVAAATLELQEAARRVTRANTRLDKARFSVSCWSGQVERSNNLLAARSS